MNLQNQLMNIGMQMNNNMGMQMNNMDMGVQMNNMDMGMQMNNMDMGMQMNNNMGMQMNNNMGMQMNNNMGMQMMINLMKKFNNQKEKINITFKTTQGNEKNIAVDYGTSIDDMFKKYLKEVNHPELINNKTKIVFLYNAKKLKFGDKTKIEDYFKFVDNPVIIVNDVNNYIN